MTDSYNLTNAKKIIHAVGPTFMNGRCDEDKILKECYISIIDLCEKYRKTNRLDRVSVAIPCISTGTFNFPKIVAANIACDTVVKKLKKNKNIDVLFVCHGDEDYSFYQTILNGKG